jgi:hypothetical protein
MRRYAVSTERGGRDDTEVPYVPPAIGSVLTSPFSNISLYRLGHDSLMKHGKLPTEGRRDSIVRKKQKADAWPFNP